jgi:hypothetical protein
MSKMQLTHTPARRSASFDEPSLVVSGGLVRAVRLAEKYVTTEANPGSKVMTRPNATSRIATATENHCVCSNPAQPRATPTRKTDREGRINERLNREIRRRSDVVGSSRTGTRRFG